MIEKTAQNSFIVSMAVYMLLFTAQETRVRQEGQLNIIERHEAY